MAPVARTFDLADVVIEEDLTTGGWIATPKPWMAGRKFGILVGSNINYAPILQIDLDGKQVYAEIDLSTFAIRYSNGFGPNPMNTIYPGFSPPALGYAVVRFHLQDATVEYLSTTGTWVVAPHDINDPNVWGVAEQLLTSGKKVLVITRGPDRYCEIDLSTNVFTYAPPTHIAGTSMNLKGTVKITSSVGLDPRLANVWSTTPKAIKCECGAAKLGHARGSFAHSKWCPWFG
jgi:hypothetical protein